LNKTIPPSAHPFTLPLKKAPTMQLAFS